jgi:hypothetical protein
MTYRPIILGCRMSDYGYWICDVSVAPGKVISVMICKTGITAEDVPALALGTLGSLPGGIAP